MTSTNKYEAIIGLEVHAQLLTDTKLFCSCKTQFGDAPNSNTCPVCLGLPGALPVMNKRAVEYAVRAALATECQLPCLLEERTTHSSVFARKNYFYPDLPKGYQISQFDAPFAVQGKLVVSAEETTKTIGITRIHMEEDAGKLLHDSLGQDANKSLVDFNRSGVPLIEIVSEPDMRTPEEASAYLRKWRQLLLYLGICDGNLEEGSMRCDANVSVRVKGERKLNTKVEIKNLNSFRFVQKAIAYEIDRQIGCYESGKIVLAETRLWDANANVTKTMRSKEEAHDYRYFPEPDLTTLHVDEEWVTNIAKTLPELPQAKLERFQKDYHLSSYDAIFLTQEQSTADYFEAAVQKTSNATAKQIKNIANWMMGDFTKALKDGGQNFGNTKIAAEKLVELLTAVENGTISGKIAKRVFEQMFATGKDAKAIIEAEGLAQISDTKALREMVEGVLDRCGKEVEEYRQGKTKLFGFFVGQVMKESRGQANPAVINKLLKEILSA